MELVWEYTLYFKTRCNPSDGPRGFGARGLGAGGFGLMVFLDKVDLVVPQETLTGLVSVSPRIQSWSWSQPGGEKIVENGLGSSKDLCTAEIGEASWHLLEQTHENRTINL